MDVGFSTVVGSTVVGSSRRRPRRKDTLVGTVNCAPIAIGVAEQFLVQTVDFLGKELGKSSGYLVLEGDSAPALRRHNILSPYS
jgi:hypothetical protein